MPHPILGQVDYSTLKDHSSVDTGPIPIAYTSRTNIEQRISAVWLGGV
jgi:hypothetical protein